MLDTPTHPRSELRRWLGILLAAFAFVTALAISTASIFGGVRPYTALTTGMSPTIQPGDRFLAESFTLRTRPPLRGELLLFSTDNISSLPPGQILIKRLAGLPGEHLQIKNGQLYINGFQITLLNSTAQTPHPNPLAAATNETDLQIPPNQYFFLADNPTNATDSRGFGPIPAQNIRSRPWFRFKPTTRPRTIN